MSKTTVDALEASLQKTRLWLKAIMDEMGWNDQQRAYLALRAVFSVLAGSVSAGEVRDVQQVLPPDIRELWLPARAKIAV